MPRDGAKKTPAHEPLNELGTRPLPLSSKLPGNIFKKLAHLGGPLFKDRSKLETGPLGWADSYQKNLLISFLYF
jgi:hypothetical protein